MACVQWPKNRSMERWLGSPWRFVCRHCGSISKNDEEVGMHGDWVRRLVQERRMRDLRRKRKPPWLRLEIWFHMEGRVGTGFKVVLESIMLDQLGDKTISQHSYSFLQLMLPTGHVLSTVSTAGDTRDLPRLWSQTLHDVLSGGPWTSPWVSPVFLLCKKGPIHKTYHPGKVCWPKYIHTYHILKITLAHRKQWRTESSIIFTF